MRARVLGAGALYEDVCETLHAHGWETLAETERTRKRVDLLLLAGATRIIPRAEYTRYPLGALCFHPSLLPRHRGRDAVYWTLAHGDPETGVTWFWLDDGLDTGPIAAQAVIPTPPHISRGALYYGHLVPLGASLLDDVLAALACGERPATPQDETRASYEPPRPAKAG
jgi:methionyl-tRNA formyltransferase